MTTSEFKYIHAFYFYSFRIFFEASLENKSARTRALLLGITISLSSLPGSRSLRASFCLRIMFQFNLSMFSTSSLSLSLVRRPLLAQAEFKRDARRSRRSRENQQKLPHDGLTVVVASRAADASSTRFTRSFASSSPRSPTLRRVTLVVTEGLTSFAARN